MFCFGGGLYPVDQSPVQALRGMGQRGGSCPRLPADRKADRASGR
jgi:hypothetical protein